VSGGVIFQESLRALAVRGLHATAERDVVRALEAAREGGPLDLLYDCGAEAGLERATLLGRGAAIFFSFAAGNLADDLADGDCHYLDEPARTGPCVQFILQNLFFATAARADVRPERLEEVTASLARAGGPQLLEVRTHAWTADLARTVGESIAGLQYAAYLRLLWADTPLEERAMRVGMALGVAGHVAKDLLTHDPRIASLPPAQASALVDWAREQTDALRKEQLACLGPMLRYIDPILERAT
jgi:hypothetical protein